MTGARLLRTLGWMVLACLAALLVLTVVWRVQGGRVERVQTPSMGTVAPVGSLLWVKPVGFDSLRVGDFITFRPPGRTSTYSHRVHVIHQDGTIGTKGELSAPDPWRLGDGDIVGKVEMTWPMAGWVVRMAPVLAAGGFLVALLARRLDQRWRGVAALVGVSVVFAVAIAVYRPFIGVEQLASKPVPGGSQGTYVSTGLLPIHLHAEPGGTDVVLSDGETGSLTVPAKGDAGSNSVRLSPAVPRSFWVVLVGLCFLPGLCYSVGQRLWRRPAAS